MVLNPDIQVGMILTYRPTFGGLRRVEVTAKDFESREPVFDGFIVDDDNNAVYGERGKLQTVWGYEDQVEEIFS